MIGDLHREGPGVIDPWWLVNADQEQVLALLGAATTSEGSVTAAVYRASMRVHGEYSPRVRRHLLALDAARFGQPELSARIADVPLDDEPAPWTVTWATGSALDDRLRFAFETPGPVDGLATGLVDGRLVLVGEHDADEDVEDGDEDGDVVKVWDLTAMDGECQYEPAADYAEVRTASRFLLGDQILAVDFDGAVLSVYDAASGEPYAEPYSIDFGEVDAATIVEVDGTAWVIASGGDFPSSALWIWELAARGTIGSAISGHVPGHTKPVSTLTTAVLDGRQVVVSCGMDSTVRLWDQASGQPVDGPMNTDRRHVERASVAGPDGPWGWRPALALLELDGRPAVATTDGTTPLRLWDVESGEPIGPLAIEFDDESPVIATGEADGRTIIVTAHDRTIQVWDPRTGEAIGEPMKDRGGYIAALAIARLRGRPCVIAGIGSEWAYGGVAVWDLATGTQVGEPLPFPSTVSAVAALSDDSGDDSIAVGFDSEVAVLRYRGV
ncbi:WD40 repeat domain-containing protein [Catenulispora pinisilvae]|uniref:WD40 repeat domain-containing protein n=1 Tax=Catenulispora pinisilvae TaxID=2705253 RepID=UPI0018924114|nr:hypothetical protein [Catenulispora pinisilvae]